MPNQHPGRRLLRYAIICLGIIMAAAILWAKRTETTSGVGFRIDVAIHRLGAFPNAVRHRNRQCSYTDVWNFAPPVDRLIAQAAIRGKMRVEQRAGPTELVDTPAGTYWIPVRDIDELAETIVEQQGDIYEAPATAVKAGDIVLDCGANVGAYTRHALSRGAKLVVAVEPAPESLDCLRKNLASEIAGGRVIVYPKGVWNKDTELQMSAGDAWASSASSVVLDRGGRGPTIYLTTIDKLVAELHLPGVDFIKMDIEGSEMQALEGAADTVRRFRPRMAISLEHRPTDPDRIPVLVKRLWPDYSAQCGPCTNVNGNIQPDVLFAHAGAY
jgi:FkbM family methyltransferase